MKTIVQGTDLLVAVMPPLRDADVVGGVLRLCAGAVTLATGMQYLLVGSRATSDTGTKTA